jgi:hypothetical protein
MSKMENEGKGAAGAVQSESEVVAEGSNPRNLRHVGAGMAYSIVEEQDSIDISAIDFSTPDSQNNIIYADDGSIKGGTVEKILQKLTSTDSNVSLLFDFLITYRSYTSPEYLLALLRRRFEQVVESEDTKIVRLRVMNFMRQWIEKHTYDWVDDAALIARFTGFIEHWETVDPTAQRTAVLLTGLLKKVTETTAQEKKKAKTFNAPPPPPEFPSELDPAKLTIHHINTAEMARQWTLLEWSYWEEIKPWEFLNCNWAGKRKETLAPNILLLTKQFNKAATWVATTILQTEALKERVKVVTKFIQLAEELRLLANFNGVMEILSGLGSASVHRLKQTWEALPKPIAELLTNLKTLMSPDASFKRYRENLKNVNPPTIPYLGISLTDLTFIYDGSKDSTATGLVNFAKCRMVAQIIKTLTQYQHTSYHFVTVPVIRDYLKYPTLWDEPSQYQFSLFIEPRPGTEPPSEPPSVVCISDPPPWASRDGSLSTDSPKTKIVKEAPRDWKSSTLVIRRGVIRAADLRHAVAYLLYIPETDANFNSFSNTFFTSIKWLGGLQKIFDVFEQLLEEAPLEDSPSVLEAFLTKSQSNSIYGNGKTAATTMETASNSRGNTSPPPSRVTSTSHLEPAPLAHKTLRKQMKKSSSEVTAETLSDAVPTVASTSSAPALKPDRKQLSRSSSNTGESANDVTSNESEGRSSPEDPEVIGAGQGPDLAAGEPFWPPKTKRELAMRILEVGVYWGTRYGSVPTRDQKALQQLQTWMEQRLILVEGMKETVQGAVISFVRTIPMLGLEATRRASSSSSPKVHPVPNVPLSQLAIRLFHPEEIARQLALWYHSEFSAFTKDEIFAVSSSSSTNNTFQGKPTSFVLLELSVQQEKWIKAEMTALEGSKKKRLATYECLLEAAQYSLDLNNFLAVRHIYNALNDAHYEILLENASKRAKDIWGQLKVLFLTAGGAAWNQKIAGQLNTDQPLVLPVEWVESSISHNQTERDWWKGRMGLFNFDKLGMVSQTWRAVERSKQPYSFTLCPSLKDYIITAATDALHDVPLRSPLSARNSKKVPKSGNEKSEEEEDSDEITTGEEPEYSDEEKKDGAGKEAKDKKKVSVFKSMFGKKKEPSSLSIPSGTGSYSSGPISPTGSAADLSKTSRKEPAAEDSAGSSTSPKEPQKDAAAKDKDAVAKEIKVTKESATTKDQSKRASSSTDKLEKMDKMLSGGSRASSKPDVSVTPRNSRGGSASSNTSSQDSSVYVNTPDFRAAVIRMVQEDDEFRSSLLTALSSAGIFVPSSHGSPSPADKKRRKASGISPEVTKIAQLEAQVEQLQLKLKLSHHPDLTDSGSSEEV